MEVATWYGIYGKSIKVHMISTGKKAPFIGNPLENRFAVYREFGRVYMESTETPLDSIFDP